MMVRQLGGEYYVNDVTIVNVPTNSASLPQGAVVGIIPPQTNEGIVLPDLNEEQKRAIQAIIKGDPSKKSVAI